MSTRGSSLQNNTAIAQIRLIDSRYDVIKEVSEHLLEIEQLAAEDIGALIDSLNEAKDFTGITVVAGTVASFDPETKVITVPTLKGDTGDTGAIGPTGPQGPIGLTGARGAQGAKGDTGAMGIQGPQGPTGPEGPAGVAGTDGADLTVEQISYNGDGTFTWQFSDNTSYTTPDLRGPQGITGAKGDKGDQGISVHHIKGTSTTDLEGDFASYGEIDTYTLYGDAAEMINLGYFRVNNGLAKDSQVGLMFRSTYDTNNSGIVDDAKKLNGLTAQEIQASVTDLYGQPNGIAMLDGSGLVTSSQLPSYVDAVIEVNTYADLPLVGESGKIYVVVVDEMLGNDTSTYRWSGSTYVLITDTMNASDIKTLYESNPNTNEFNDAEKSLIDYTTSLDTTAITLPTAINEVKSVTDGHISESVGAHQSSSITNSAGTNVYAVGNNVETAISQLDAEIVAQDSRLDTLEGDSSIVGSVDKKIVEQSELADYTNMDSGLLATTIKGAIDELANEVIIEVHTLYADLPTTGLVNRLYVITADETNDNNSSTYIWNNGSYELITNTLTSANIQAMYESQPNKVLNDVTTIDFGTGDGSGVVTWNATEMTLDLVMNSEVTYQMGEELFARVRNDSVVTIPNGTVVMVTGAVGASGNMTVSPHDGTRANARRIAGIATQDILPGTDGFSLLRGKIGGINTTGALVGETWSPGDWLYLKPNDNGALTKVVPVDGEVMMPIAYVLNVHAINGTLQVRSTGIDENAFKDWVNAKLSVIEW